MEVQFAQKAIVIKENKLLLIQKDAGDPYHPMEWEVPGGRLEFNETLDQHIKREVFEEVGLGIDVGRPLAIWSWTLGNDPEAPTVVAVARECWVTLDGTQSINFDGHSVGDHIGAWKWVPVGNVADYDLIPAARQPILDSLEILSR